MGLCGLRPMPLGQVAASLEEVADEEILHLLIECEMHAATATAAARRAFSELPAAARRSRRARFCEPAVPP